MSSPAHVKLLPARPPAVSHRRSPSVARGSRPAFTLVELLVVVAVISMLVSILMPSLGRARDYTRLVLCQNNHHLLMTGTHLYSQTCEGRLPFSNWQSQEDYRGTYKGPGWLYKWPDRTLPRHLEAGQLWPYMPSPKGYHCPADQPPYTGGPTHRITSYMMNGAVTGYGKQMPPWSAVDMPPDGIIYWEVGTGSWNDGSSTPSEDITDRHRDGAVVSCFDGHAAWMTYADFYDEEARRPGRLWCNPGAVDGTR